MLILSRRANNLFFLFVPPSFITTTTFSLFLLHWLVLSLAVREVHQSHKMDTALEILDPLVFDRAYSYFFPGPAVACDAVRSASWSTSSLLSAVAAHNATAKVATSAIESCIVSSLPRDDIRRQCASILFSTLR